MTRVAPLVHSFAFWTPLSTPPASPGSALGGHQSTLWEVAKKHQHPCIQRACPSVISGAAEPSLGHDDLRDHPAGYPPHLVDFSTLPALPRPSRGAPLISLGYLLVCGESWVLFLMGWVLSGPIVWWDWVKRWVIIADQTLTSLTTPPKKGKT
jgi:hypothetical protein